MTIIDKVTCGKIAVQWLRQINCQLPNINCTKPNTKIKLKWTKYQKPIEAKKYQKPIEANQISKAKCTKPNTKSQLKQQTKYQNKCTEPNTKNNCTKPNPTANWSKPNTNSQLKQTKYQNRLRQTKYQLSIEANQLPNANWGAETPNGFCWHLLQCHLMLKNQAMPFKAKACYASSSFWWNSSKIKWVPCYRCSQPGSYGWRKCVKSPLWLFNPHMGRKWVDG